ncbi:DNA-directed RNA polymerase subunit beta [Paenibacillus chartarius]|uniref:DNA-directed RNA polymerase subunit beta n=1 Tax=Paenibacillus chartarius TaxID=747481 RepID=A0ABV6DJV0_9BACL
MTEQGNTKEARRRPIWLKVTLGLLKYGWFPVACLVALLVGLTAGYVVLGGGSASDVFEFQTWQHLFDLVFAAE